MKLKDLDLLTPFQILEVMQENTGVDVTARPMESGTSPMHLMVLIDTPEDPERKDWLIRLKPAYAVSDGVFVDLNRTPQSEKCHKNDIQLMSSFGFRCRESPSGDDPYHYFVNDQKDPVQFSQLVHLAVRLILKLDPGRLKNIDPD